MNLDRFIDLFKLGLKPIPLIWDAETKSATSHCIEHGKVTAENYTETTFSNFINDVSKANGIALKLFPPFGCIDFDLKNTDDKGVFNAWMKAVQSQDDDIFSKICIEKTRNAGYHIYIKYPKLKSKVSLARETKGEEVIALYTGGTLSYCDPTPGYDMFHNELTDLQDLTDDEFDILMSCAQSFDKYIPVVGEKSNIITEYPTEYENLCLQFDKNITDEALNLVLNEVGLFNNLGYKYNKKDKFIAYLRKGSKANLSAKVYFNTHNVQLFTSSLRGFPHWGSRKDKDDHSWNLTPSRLVYYDQDGDWTLTVAKIQMICDSANIEIINQEPVTNQSLILGDRLKFPYDIFPDPILDFINYSQIQHDYLAAAALGAVSAIIGNSATLIANDGYFVKPILYLAMVAPPGASKSPSLKSIFSFLERHDADLYKQYENEKLIYKQALGNYKNQKKGDGIDEPHAPIMKQVLIKDSTIEMVVKILSFNSSGCCILADELSGFLKRMNRYGDNDEVQKWLELWSGSPVLLQRISRDENKVENPFCSIVGGIQPGVLDSLSSKDNEHNGFYHRFLFCYPEPDKKKDWETYKMPEQVKISMDLLFSALMNGRDAVRYYKLSSEANALYADWFNNKNKKYNFTTEDNVKGIIAKYQDYCLRFSLIIQVMYDAGAIQSTITQSSMERAIRLTEYFLGNMHKSMKILAPATPLDRISGNLLDFYKALPATFSMKTAIEISLKLNLKQDYARVVIGRWSDKKDQILIKSGEQKNANYEKIF
jgi:hypothetical protein